MFPAIAVSMSRSLGLGFSCSKAIACMIWPDWQYPHWGTEFSIHAFWTGCKAPSAANASMVTISWLATPLMGVVQERIAFPLRWTVHDPHKPSPQPYLVPDKSAKSRTYHNNGISGSPP